MIIVANLNVNNMDLLYSKIYIDEFFFKTTFHQKLILNRDS